MQNPMPPVNTPDNVFHDGNPLTGELGTIVTALFMNNVQAAIRNSQAEIISVLADAGIVVDPNKTDQLLTALKATFATNTNVNGRVPVTRKVNGKALSADITLTAGDVGALPAAGTAVAATKLATARKIAGVAFDGTADIALSAAGVGALAKDQNGADIPNKAEFRKNLELLKQVQYGASQDELLVARWSGGVGKRTSDFLPPSTQVGDFRYNGVWYGLVGATGATDIPSNGTIYNMFAHNTGNYGAQFWFSTVDEPASFRYRIVSNGGVGVWREVMTLDSAQTVGGMKTFSETPRITRSNFPGVVMTCTNVSEGAVGREVSMLSDLGNVVFIARKGDGTDSEQRIVRIPMSVGGTVLVSSEIAGMPQLYPGAVAPTGWLKCNGQSFDKILYPVLASRYQSGVLPDLRGEFVRGWDDGRGVDAGRALLSAQGDAIRNITGKFNPGGNGVNGDSALFTAGSWGQASNSGAAGDSSLITFDASKVVPTANENRPRNIAFNYIVRAA